MKPADQAVQDEAMREMLHDAADLQVISSAEVIRRFESLEKRVSSVEAGVGINTAITTDIAGNTAELLNLFKSVKGGFAVMGWLGTFAKWIAGIAAAFAAIYAFVQNIKGGH